ncbi:hypothetical protein [Geodermatophilus marinus]|uniref:hypothetical protein n=1 Tax=Geodermatophilus sp. LHW52908 TaxID=2303986 RepID=UPI000E3BDCD2|nr:hypothetical protein [Geodermatophilus sp. LHW52908]RFU22022.1 hypothetical protein D0Z06_07815 [Geodermatophilus sp. LHW52908]
MTQARDDGGQGPGPGGAPGPMSTATPAAPPPRPDADRGTGGAAGAAPAADRGTARRSTMELVAVVVLATTTILTAWSAFQSSKWGGAMSIAFSEASSSRIEAARLDGAANVRTSNHIALFTQWAAAVGAQDAQLADFLVARFPEPLATAHADWLATTPPGVVPAGSPFDMPSYVLPERVEAQAADARAAGRFGAALANNQRGDNYTILTVLFATVLFFTAMSTKVQALRSQQALLGAAVVLGLVGVGFLIGFPKLV